MEGTKGQAWYYKCFYGALGGLCLVIVRLLIEGFFFAEGVNYWGIGLAATALMVLSAIWTLTEDDTRPSKLIKFGFAAPSVLLLLVTQGAADRSKPMVTPSDDIPKIEDVEEVSSNEGASRTIASDGNNSNAETSVETIDPKSLRGDFKAGARAFIGLPYEKASYAFVVGRSSKKEPAQKMLERLNLSSQSETDMFKLIKLPNKEFLIIGGGITRYSTAIEMASKLKVNSGKIIAPQLLEVVNRGSVVDLSTIASPKD